MPTNLRVSTMSSLRELQATFAGILFGEIPLEAATWLRVSCRGASGPEGQEAAVRLGIYRNNLQAGFAKALSLEFPVIERLVGTACFRQLAREFQQAHPSRAGDLHEIGAAFPGYLHSRFSATEFAYLHEVAMLEWAYQRSAVAADAPDFDPMTLVAAAADSYADLRFELKPDCLLVRSAYPVLRIWQANQPGAAEETIDLASGADCIVTRRQRDGVELRRISTGLYALLDAFSAGKALLASWTEAQRAEPGFDLGEALRQAVALRLLAAPRDHLND